MTNFDDLLPPTLEIARKAGAVAMQYFSKPIDVDIKDDGSEVTAADHAVNDVIMAELAKLTPNIPIISEETANDHIDVSAGTFWCVDPIDGTRGFIKKNNHWGINIALIHDFLPLIGVVYLPTQQWAYTGVVGKQAKRIEDNGQETIIKVRPYTKERIIAFVNSEFYLQTPENQRIVDCFGVTEIKALGGPLRPCNVAEGAGDISFTLHPCSEWDTAAPHAILKAAGGAMVNVENFQPLRYGKAGFKNRAFIGVGDKIFLERLECMIPTRG